METLKRVLIILLAAGLIFAAMLPLAQTDWAAEMRNAPMEGEEGEGPEGRDFPAGLGLIMGFIKETVMMLVAGAITLLIYRNIKRGSRQRKKVQASAGC